jgi:hypothetical protein
MSGDVVHAWRPPVPGVREVFHARFHDHAYPRHAHDVWTVLVVDAGDIRYALDGVHHGADTAVVTVLPPHVAHDGHAGPAGAFVKRVLYLDETVLDLALVGPAVDRPQIDDRALRAALRRVHGELARLDDPLRVESRLVVAVERLARHLRRGRAGAVERQSADLAESARGLLDAHLVSGITRAAGSSAHERCCSTGGRRARSPSRSGSTTSHI